MKNPPNGDIINEDIRFKEVLVIGPDDEKLGVMSRYEALNKAHQEYNLDLLLVSAQSSIPVVKIIDYGKYQFDQQKKNKEAKKKQHIISNKEIRLTLRIGQKDLITKTNKAIEFLKEGNRVKVSLKFKGRELAKPEKGKQKLMEFYDLVQEYGMLEKEPKLNNSFYDFYITAKKKR